MSAKQDYTHPQYKGDRQIVNSLMGAEPTDYTLAELARLRIRYDGFPGARDIQRDLDQVLKTWGLTEETLFEKTRAIHQGDPVYTPGRTKGEDWS